MATPGRSQSRVAVSFVCSGNICRSPTAEAVMRHLVAQAGLEGAIHVDSAGIGDWHVGEPPDERSAAVGRRRGMPLAGEARQWKRADFTRFDYVLALDRGHLRALRSLAPDAAAAARVRLLRSFDPVAAGDLDVPDPYYGGAEGFDEVFEMCLAACRALLDHIRKTHGL